MMLTLLLRSLKWSDVGEKKKEKAIKTMSRFFHVPMVNSHKICSIHHLRFSDFHSDIFSRLMTEIHKS
jgi:hypothetical protein